MIKGIDNVGVAVTDLVRSVAFYEKLGFHKGDEYEAEVKGCTMSSERAVLFLFQDQTTQAPNRPPRGQSGPQSARPGPYQLPG